MSPDKPTQDEQSREGGREGDRSGQAVPPAREDAQRVEDAYRAEPGHRTKVTLDELMAKGRTFVDRVESVVRRVADRIGRRSG